MDRMREFLSAPRDAPRAFCILVARQANEMLGGSVFSYVAQSNCGFSEYIVVAGAHRGSGLGRRLFEARKAILDELARHSGHAGCNGLFIEVDSPERTPAEFLDAERETALDAWDRLRIFEHLGFRRVAVRYEQPPLGAHKAPVDYLDLLFAPWTDPGRVAIPRAWVEATVEPIWCAWAPEAAPAALERLRGALSAPQVALAPLLGAD